ncbi:MAG: crossover junction endodeoxyribonuclease RuvC [Desulfovibrionales bacterium]
MPPWGGVVLGLDPGSRCTGYGIVREAGGTVSLVDTGTIRLPAELDLGEKLGRIFTRVAELIQTFAPQESALEDVFMSKNAASALKLGQARGAALAACAVNGLHTATYTPAMVKKTLVGRGRADKGQVAFMVGQILGCPPNWAEDASDALAVAICHLNQRRWQKVVGGP